MRKTLLVTLLALGAAFFPDWTPAEAATLATYATVDSGDDVGGHTSVTIGADGLPLVSYYDNTNHDLKAAHCGNPTCTDGNSIVTVDSVGDVGGQTSVTIGIDGLPLISYFDYTNDDLKVAHCGDATCTAGNSITTVASGDVGEETSSTVGADGLPVLAFFDYANGDLKVAHCGDAACTAGNSIVTVDSAGVVGLWPSVAAGADSLPLISYYEFVNADLKVAHCGDAACAVGNSITTVDSVGSTGLYSSVRIGTDGLPFIGYYDNSGIDLEVAHCGNVACTAGNGLTTVDSAGGPQIPAVTIGSDGFPFISYYEGFIGLKVAHCGNRACTVGNSITTVDSGGVGQQNSVAIGAHGLPLISYYDHLNLDLKVARCTNRQCTGPPDVDLDGCTDAQEAGPDAGAGGQRNAKNFWDFFDTPAAAAARDRVVSAADIATVIGRYGASDTGAGDFDRNSDPLSTPNPAAQPAAVRQNYHPAYDRGGVGGPQLWSQLPPNGSITAGDVAAAVAQFGHSCA